MICARLYGRSVRDCACMLKAGGWAECPTEARRPLAKLAAAVIASMEDTRATAIPQPVRRNYSGDICADCGGPNMVRTGTCLTCQDCGSSSGGCS